MKSDPKVIQHLNDALGNELIAINQYFLHSKMLASWGFQKLAKIVWDSSIDEMKHAQILTERVLVLKGMPNLQNLGKLFIGQTVKETLECDLKLERLAVPTLKQGIAYAEQVSDYVSRDILNSILQSEEEHIDWIETQLELMNTLGEKNYLQLQV